MIIQIVQISSSFIYLLMTPVSYVVVKILSLELELTKLCEWPTANKLTLNAKKSNDVMFWNYRKKLSFKPTINIFDIDKMSYSPLECKDYVKYLGILIDKNLNWKTHIGLIALKNSKTIGMIAKLRHFVPLSIIVKLYQSLILPYLSRVLARGVKRQSQLWIS